MIELVARHGVHFAVWPEQAVVDGELRKIGFQVDLYGYHHHPKHVATPGCDECVKVYRALRRIAKFVLPIVRRRSEYEVQSFDQRLHYQRGSTTGAVVLPIRIVHRRGYLEPTDDCERTCLAEIETNLQSLGAARSAGASRPPA